MVGGVLRRDICSDEPLIPLKTRMLALVCHIFIQSYSCAACTYAQSYLHACTCGCTQQRDTSDSTLAQHHGQALASTTYPRTTSIRHIHTHTYSHIHSAPTFICIILQETWTSMSRYCRYRVSMGLLQRIDRCTLFLLWQSELPSWHTGRLITLAASMGPVTVGSRLSKTRSFGSYGPGAE